MGVKDLWSILSPVCERKSLWELQDKTIAIDLSCWICDSQNVKNNASQPRMYLRNLFFRTNCLLLLGAHPIFVLEGKAPELKYNVMEKRQAVRNRELPLTEKDTKSKGKRSRLNSLLHMCQQLLTIMGLTCVKSMGEAEAFCALLNRFKHVDGCITQDGDSFLYGAQTVYRNFTISSSGGCSLGFSVDVYKMSVIEDQLFLDQNALIAISLLCGCDYNEKGVTGVGKETVLKFLQGVRGEDVLNRLKNWRSDSYFDKLEEKRTLVSRGVLCEMCGHSGRKIKHAKNGCELCGKFQGCKKNDDFPLSDPAIVAELNIRKRALLDPEFPSQLMIDEFLHQQFPSDEFILDNTWKKPDLKSFVLFAVKLLGWTEFYAFEKFLPLVTRWQLTELQKSNAHSELKFPFSPNHIVKKRVTRGVRSYEIQWNADDREIQVNSSISLVTVEPQHLVDKAYPKIVESYLISKKVKTKKGATEKIKKLNSDENTKITMDAKENNVLHSMRKQTRIDRFLNSPIIVQKKRCVLKDQTNIVNTCTESSKDAPATSLKKQTEVSSVKMISDYFSEMNLEPKPPLCQKSVCAVELLECENSVLSHVCYHQKEKTTLEDSRNFEKSLCLDVCEICNEDDPIDDKDLSVIVDSIVNRKIVDETKDDLLKTNQIVSGDSIICSENISFDEFDYLEDKCIPLIDRLRAKHGYNEPFITSSF